jgi:hypothetical protein
MSSRIRFIRDGRAGTRWGAVEPKMFHHHRPHHHLGEQERAEDIQVELQECSHQHGLSHGKDWNSLEAPVIKLQRRWLQKNYPQRLHRYNLSDRLLFESSMMRGVFRLVNQSLIFCLMVVAALLGSNPAVKRGVYQDLVSSFNLNALPDIKSRTEFQMEWLPKISRKSKDYFILSSKYFHDGGRGNILLLGPMTIFSTPLLVGDMIITIEAPQVSFCVWAKTDYLFSKGHIVRKRLNPGSEFSCWGWYLDVNAGPQLHYGVHDLFPTDVDNPKKERQVEIRLREPRAFNHSQYVLMTMVISRTEVTFYHNLELLSVEPLPRPMTDCFNNNEGVLVGSVGMTLGSMRFYPRPLSPSDIEEIYTFGSRLSDMATGSTAADGSEEVASASKRAILASIGKLQSDAALQKEQMGVGMVLQNVENLQQLKQHKPSTPPPMPLGVTLSESYDVLTDAHTPSYSSEVDRNFYLVLQGPYRLTETSDTHARYLSHVPDFRGSGATITWWYRHVKCNVKTCGVYLLHAGDFVAFGGTRDWCWSIWIENEAIWYDGSPNSGYQYFTNNGVDEKYQVRYVCVCVCVTWISIIMESCRKLTDAYFADKDVDKKYQNQSTFHVCAMIRFLFNLPSELTIALTLENFALYSVYIIPYSICVSYSLFHIHF